MLIVAPKGNMNRVTLLSTLLFSSRQRNVMGNVAELFEILNKRDQIGK